MLLAAANRGGKRRLLKHTGGHLFQETENFLHAIGLTRFTMWPRRNRHPPFSFHTCYFACSGPQCLCLFCQLECLLLRYHTTCLQHASCILLTKLLPALPSILLL